jgi:hypothetical protein
LIIFVLTFLSILVKVILLRRTKYVFYDNLAVKEFRFFIVRKTSVIYNRVTNISLKISLWDRMTSAGQITIHTGDDELPDIIISFVKNPERIEGLIYSLIHKKNIHLRERIIK